MSDWQPIETAPRDGTRVDLWAKQWRVDDDVFIYHRFADCWWMKTNCITGDPGRWANLADKWFPTHWMPLPEPPKVQA